MRRAHTYKREMGHKYSSFSFNINVVQMFFEALRSGQWGGGGGGGGLDSGSRGWGFEPHSGRRVVSLSKTYIPPKSTGNTQEAKAPSQHD